MLEINPIFVFYSIVQFFKCVLVTCNNFWIKGSSRSLDMNNMGIN